MAAPDLAEFMALSKPKRPPCAVGVALSALSKVEREQLTAACAQDMAVITNSAIQQWLESRGHKTSPQLVTSHRKATCCCHG